MIARIAAFALLAVTLAACEGPSPRPQGAETAFVETIQNDLGARYPTPAAAEKAGYFRYTDEDSSGAISYVLLDWQSDNQSNPSQLWYSAGGKLLGADFAMPKDISPGQPDLWGVDPRRWHEFPAHVHYVLAGPGGTQTYGYVDANDFRAAGGDPDKPQASTLVAMHRAKNVAQVKHIFLFPEIWDLQVWILPNPDGAFAEKNPLVKPSANAKDMM